eukprot:scaffold29856_cov63-Phaeocystis_antarctica.AAC.2
MALPPLAVRKPAAPTAHRLPEDEMPKPATPTALLSLLSCVVKSSCDVEDATTTQMELAKILRVPVISYRAPTHKSMRLRPRPTQVVHGAACAR